MLPIARHLEQVFPLPGLLTEVAAKAGQEVRAGEPLAVIEALKMQNTRRAESDCVVAELLASPGDWLSVDQPTLCGFVPLLCEYGSVRHLLHMPAPARREPQAP